MSSMEFNKGQNHPEHQVKEEHKFSNSSDFEAWMDGLQNAQYVIKGSNVIQEKHTERMFSEDHAKPLRTIIRSMFSENRVM